MARKKEKRGDKANAIRSAFEELGWKTAPKVVIAKLAAANMTVTPAQVSNIRTKQLGVAKSKRGPGRRGKGRASLNGLTVEQLIEVRDFVKSAGGVENVRHALDVLATLA